MKKLITGLVMCFAMSSVQAGEWWQRTDNANWLVVIDTADLNGSGPFVLKVDTNTVTLVEQNTVQVEFIINHLRNTRIKSSRFIKQYHCGKQASSTIGMALFTKFDAKGELADDYVLYIPNNDVWEDILSDPLLVSYDSVLLKASCMIAAQVQ